MLDVIVWVVLALLTITWIGFSWFLYKWMTGMMDIVRILAKEHDKKAASSMGQSLSDPSKPDIKTVEDLPPEVMAPYLRKPPRAPGGFGSKTED
jgi:hypothetical protein